MGKATWWTMGILWLTVSPLFAELPVCDLSAVSEVLSPVTLTALGPAGTVHHEIAIPESCPKETGPVGMVMPNGDGDGDGANDDRQLDINGGETGRAEMATNGNVELWCIDPRAQPVAGYYALLFVPAGGGAARFIGKCPFEGGRNRGWKFINPRNGNIEEIHWESIDRGRRDDDGDGDLDKWFYTYKPGPDTLEEEHFEDHVKQGDGRGPAMPPVRPFGFGDILPRNPRQDDPTAINFELPDGEMFAFLPEIQPGAAEELVIATHVVNEGPCEMASSRVTLTVVAPPGCTVGPAGSAPTVAAETSLMVGAVVGILESTFQYRCDLPGIHVFDVITEVAPVGGIDPVPEDDRSAGTFTVHVSGIYADGFESGNTSRWSFVSP